MTPPLRDRRSAAATPSRLFAVLALLAATLPIALHAGSRGRVEVALVVAFYLLLSFAVLPRIGFRRWSPAERAIVHALLLATLFGQLLGRPHVSFPFLPWTMYGERPDVEAPASALELRAAIGGVERIVSLREVFGERGFAVGVMLDRLDAKPAVRTETLAAITRLLEERTGELVLDLRRVPADRDEEGP